MSSESNDLETLIERHRSAAALASEAQAELYESLAREMESPEHGQIQRLAEITGLSRETLRRLGKTYYRSILHWNGDEALIKQPSDSLHPEVVYEIRDTDRKTVLAKVRGQEIIDLRHRQLADYLANNPDRTNISLVDVSSLLP